MQESVSSIMTSIRDVLPVELIAGVSIVLGLTTGVGYLSYYFLGEDVNKTRVKKKDIDNDDNVMTGMFQQTSTENYKDLLAELGYNYLIRQALTLSPLVQEVSDTDGVWTIKTITALLSYKIEFRIGEELDYTWRDGREVKVLFTMENDNRLVSVHMAKRKGKKSVKIVREFTEDGLVQTTTIVGNDDFVCVMKFKRI